MVEELEDNALLFKSIPASLSPRQREVLLGLIHGHGEKQIALKLNLSVHTVHVYVKGIYDHYDVHTRNELYSRCIVQLLRVYNLETRFNSINPVEAERLIVA